MTSYSYPNNPIIPQNQADPAALTNYGAAQPAAYNRFPPGIQPDNQQWNQANPAYGQQAVAAAAQYQTYDQAGAYNGKCGICLVNRRCGSVWKSL